MATTRATMVGQYHGDLGSHLSVPEDLENHFGCAGGRPDDLEVIDATWTGQRSTESAVLGHGAGGAKCKALSE